MIRILFYLAIIFALGIGFAWLADRPGEMVVTFDGYQYTVSLMVAAVLVVAIVAVVMFAWWIIKGIWNSPQAVSRYFRVRRRDRGYQALSTGMIAAGAGDASTARRHKKQAMKLISADQEPLIHLLDAQASLLEGDHDAARSKFEAMLDDPEMRLLGLRGLFLEAERLGDRDAAHHYAQRAAETAPQLPWAASATLEARTSQHDWDRALRLLETQKSTRQIDREAAARRKAVLLTAKAMDLLESDPMAARNAATEANRLAPELVPAAVIAARALFRQGDLKKGSKILESAWKRTAHPEIADAYVNARPGDSTHDRLSRARRLRSLRLNNAEAELVVAHAALAAGENAAARKHAESAIRIAPSEAAYLLMADIEEAETGDQGRVRQWLGKAIKAPPDPAWVADGIVAERWAPVSPVTGRLDAFEWRQPVERLGAVIDQDNEDSLLLPPAEPEPAPKPDLIVPGPTRTTEETAGATGDKPGTVAPIVVEAEPAVTDSPEDDEDGKPVDPVGEKTTAGRSDPAAGAGSATDDHSRTPAGKPSREAVKEEAAAPLPAASKKPPESAPERPSGGTVVGLPVREREPRHASGNAGADAPHSDAGFILPDDPGVDPNEAVEDESSRKFRLF
ncbi:MAG: heme biosynthesis protein HemY [Rhizobiaceae bacterium]|nr:heme biosynthesis protein HemY [Rhizobiaceae bacterium]MCV0407626.1 heme biosynthesis protein HemY [Rhizobiaceae bacterium]